MTTYTVTTWTVKRGREDEFVAAWHALIEWTIEAGHEAHATLLRDHDDPHRYVSVGQWPSADAVQAWRASDGFAERFARVEETARTAEPATLDVILQVS